jgi:YhcH/YjgK/YiaL family protein
MILDTLNHSQKYFSLHPLFATAFEYLQQTDFTKLDFGKHELVPDQLFAIYMEYETKDTSECTLEAHRKFIDIQMIISGEEFMEVSRMGTHVTSKPYNPENDLEFFDGMGTSKLYVNQGSFAVFYPEDVHKPNVKVQQAHKMKKVVMKVRV